MFSFMGPQHARILHAHFDGEKLQVNYTPLYDFRTLDIPVLQLLARWYISTPVGNTRVNIGGNLP